MKYKQLFPVSAFAVLCGCGGFGGGMEPIELDENASMVQLHRSKPGDNCTYKEKIIALEDRQGRIMFGKKDEVNQSARNAMKNKALDAGANYVYLDPADDKDNIGHAYFCPDRPYPREMVETPAPQQMQYEYSRPQRAPAPAYQPQPVQQKSELRQRLEEVKSLYEDGLISEDEYNNLRKRVLEDF